MNSSKKSENSFEPHDVVWTDQKIARYWDHLSKLPAALNNCWSKQVGKALVRHVLAHRPLEGRVLDYGCGPGFLIDDLLQMAPAATIYGTEHSPESMNFVNREFAGRPGFGGVQSASTLPTPYEDASFDSLFFVETIEHIQPAQRSGALRELRRLLRPGGLVVVTTPNEEDIEANKAVCPDCGARFHVIQHLSSWSSLSLESVMQDAGFRTVSCGATRLQAKRSILTSVRDALFRRHLPHLVYLGVAA